MENLEKYANAIKNASRSFAEAVRSLNEARLNEAQLSFMKVVKTLDESGRYKALVETSIAELRLDPGFKEELLSLINMLDEAGDLVKEASREFTITPFLEIPVQIRNGLVEISIIVSEIISKFNEAVFCLIRGDYDRLDAIVKEVLELEEKADKLEIENRARLLQFGDRLKPITLQLLIHDLNALLENIADACTRSITRIRLISSAWLR